MCFFFSLYFNLIFLDGSQKLPWMEEVEWTNSKGTTVIVKCTADTESKLNFMKHTKGQ